MRTLVVAIVAACVLVSSPARAAPFTLQDVMIVADSSGSLGSSGWDQVRDFINDLVVTHAEPGRRFGLVQFASAAHVRWQFIDDQDPSTITSFVDSSSFGHLGGRTSTDSALTLAIGEFQAYSAVDAARSLILITDGNPYPLDTENPCSSGNSTPNHLFANDIEVQIVGVGNQWNPALIDCIVDDPSSQIHDITSFDATSILPPLVVGAPAGLMVLPALGLVLLRGRTVRQTRRHAQAS